jgi:hypothetical protein
VGIRSPHAIAVFKEIIMSSQDERDTRLINRLITKRPYTLQDAKDYAVDVAKGIAAYAGIYIGVFIIVMIIGSFI